jgi:hypothetical protein
MGEVRDPEREELLKGLYIGHLKRKATSRMNSGIAVMEIRGVFRTGGLLRFISRLDNLSAAM